MHDEPRTPLPGPRPDPKRETAKVASDDDASLKAGLAKLALEEAPGSTPRTGARLRNYFLTGLVVVGPVGITLYIAWNFIALVDGWVKPYVPSIYNPDSYMPFPVPGVGLVFAVLLLTIIGALAANLLGRSLISAGELMLGRTPIVRNVYQGLKQIFESVVSASSPQQAFQKVAVMEFPSKGIWSIVFVTGEAAREVSKEIPGQDLVSVFMPTGMLPPSGFVCFVPRKNVVPIHMSVEDAAKIIISAGMVNPETQAKLRDIAAKARNGMTGQHPTVVSVPPAPAQAPPPAA
ncbi:MAG TPA: DUF502 domain-containing protein [Hyphomicrobiaceae bacterium]|nr:DUF502 domain-containing protein [Hyphomicrobiaceae bacterium]